MCCALERVILPMPAFILLTLTALVNNKLFESIICRGILFSYLHVAIFRMCTWLYDVTVNELRVFVGSI